MAVVSIGFLLGLILPLLFLPIPIRERNFRGESLPILGFLIPLISSIYCLIFKDFLPATALLVFGILGLLDDVWGRKDVKGFKGHFSLLMQGKFSTGWLKALGGGIGGLLIASFLHRSLPLIILSAFIISASANLLNLLDLRPGRCLKAFALLSLLPLFFGKPYPFIFSFSLGFLVYDLREKAMLGDVGSNSLGALLGFSLCFAPIILQLFYALFLLLALVLSEFISFGRVIERNPLLRFLDGLGRRTPL
ncbi:MAG: glycosyltransferase [bacterium]